VLNKLSERKEKNEKSNEKEKPNKRVGEYSE